MSGSPWAISRSDLELMGGMDNFVQAYARQCNEYIEAHLMRGITWLEGRAPTRDELQKHGLSRIHPDGGQDWIWRNMIILKRLPGFPARFLAADICRRKP